jgi:hypothetical protein
MGIRGLGNFLRWKTPAAVKPLRLIHGNQNQTQGQRWGVDIQCLLCRARSGGLSPLTVIASLIVRLRRAGIEPLVVFDGKAPVAKTEVTTERRAQRAAAQTEMNEIKANIEAKERAGQMNESLRVTMMTRVDELQRKAPIILHNEKDEIKQFLYAAGVLSLTASGEADDVLAYFCRTGITHAVISTDMDMLARGIPRLIVPETNDGVTMTEISLAGVLAGLGLTYPQFVDACVLMGSDYTGRAWRSVEPRMAVDAARRGVVWTAMDVSGDVCDALAHSAEMLRGDGVMWDTLLNERQRSKWDAGRPAVEAEALQAFHAKAGWPADWLGVLGGGGTSIGAYSQ